MIPSIEHSNCNVIAIEIGEKNVIITFQSPFCPMVGEGKRSKMNAYDTAHPKQLMGSAKTYCSYLFA